VRTVDDSTRTRGTGDVGRRLRTTLVLAATAVLLSGCYGGDDPAATNHLGFEDGVAPVEDKLTTLETVLIYGLTPLVILLVIAALVWLPGMVRSSRYRPSRGWTAAPLWFGGPADPAAAVESASTGDLVRGGASGSW
jgi:hypothetical protein